ncbi:efflux RND transporter permease subunit [Magnetospirillum sp. UT-4]|uniref:efflux RND transporter permease subunit n=1 Tax=Magnetospirillum sp. UT-4 TaxID=2681467 RepID=UPI001383881F|nr:efflux RND transporter permease subunit [Magnetospirillum sp. UT-4]CAA7625305.1 Multidrug resistance protein [Magnetospirillum sp. UT-4]
MRLPDLCIRRPVFATVLSLLIVLVGIVSYDRLTVREYPNIDEPVVTVETAYKGASAEIVETQVTKVLEDSLAGIEGVEVLSSLSRQESSQITVRFKVTRDADAAANDVRDRVSRVRSKLPEDVDEPVIAKVEADANPIIYLAFSSDRHDALFVSDYAWRFVRTRLQNLNGVADIRIFGERRYAMRVWLERARLAAYRLTPQDVENALRRQNLEVPAGRIESAEREFTVLSETDLRTPAQFGDIILADVSGYPVRLKDVARVEIGPQDERRITRFNGSSAVALGVVKQSVANPLDVSTAVRAALPEIRGNLPEGMQVDVGYDSSVFIERSIDAVFYTIGEAVLLVVLVIFFFLRTLRATIIPLVTIPVSLIGAFAIMYALNFSINTLTLLSMVLAIGLVVDDAIVVLENIFRHIEEGLEPMAAAFKGAKEISFAVMAMTITLAAVYVPLAFMTGRTGKLFVEFALTLAAAVLVSGFVALTLSPMMCSRLLRHEPRHSWIYNLIERGLERMTEGYKRLLARSLNARSVVVGIGAAVALSSVGLVLTLKSELTPTEDRGTIVVVGIGPEGATVGNIDKYARMIERFVAEVPVVERYFVVTGMPVVNQMLAFVRVKDWSERSVSQMDVARGLMPKLMSVPGMLAFAVNPPSLGEKASSKPLQVVIQTSASYADLQRMNDAFMAEASKLPGLISLDSDLKLNKPQIRVTMDRDRIADIGSSVDVVGRTLETMLGGRQVTRFKREGEQYDVIVQVADVDRRNPDDLTSIYVRGDKDQMVQLSNLLTIQEGVAPRELNHFNQLRAATISANLAPGYTMGQAITELEAIAARVLPANAQLDYNGPSREFKSSSTAMWLTFALALLFIYLVLAAQFESFVDPFIIMLTVPLSIAGALGALKLAGGTLNVYSQIGLVTLIGLITKHGILIVEFSNQLRDKGATMKAAVTEAAGLRLRPILMTTGAMVLGAIPLALADGAGAESRQQIGWVIVGGIAVGTIFTLFVVPVAYTLLARRHRAGSLPEAEEGAPAE